jgi:hypothetical protein
VLLFVSRVVLASLALTLIIVFLAALPRAILVIVLEVASAGAVAAVALVLARKQRASRAAARSSRALQARGGRRLWFRRRHRPDVLGRMPQWPGSKEG